jgi:hypothetical protein
VKTDEPLHTSAMQRSGGVPCFDLVAPAMETVHSFVKATSPVHMTPLNIGTNFSKNRSDCEHSFGTLAEFLGQGWRDTSPPLGLDMRRRMG